MKVRDYKLFVENNSGKKGGNIRTDEFSYLNDELDQNKSRWSIDDEDEEDDDSFYDDDDKIYTGMSGMSSNSGRYNEFEEEYGAGYESEDDIQSDDMQHLTYLLRSMFRNSGIHDVEVDSKGLDVMVYCIMSRRERLSNIIKAFEVAAKLKKDILSQYDSDFEMFETKSGSPMLTFNFYYNEGLDDDNAPF